MSNLEEVFDYTSAEEDQNEYYRLKEEKEKEQIQDENETTIKEEQTAPTPKSKPKKKISEERRAQLLENLRKGREKQRLKRLEKKQLAESKKSEEERVNQSSATTTKTQDVTSVRRKYNPKADIEELKQHLRELKEMVNKTKTQVKVESKIEKKIEKLEKQEIEPKEKTSKQHVDNHVERKQQAVRPPTPLVASHNLFKIASW